MTAQEIPGGEIIVQGLDDLRRRIESPEALLVSMAATRLRDLGIPLPESTFDSPEIKLYQLLASRHGAGGHSKYNAWRRRLSSFLRSVPCAGWWNAGLVRGFMAALGREIREETRVYLAGGACAVLIGWRTSTIDVDVKIVPDAAYSAIASVKEALQLNVELASPHDFIPALPGWEERSPFILQEEKVSFFHFDFCSQALAKVERGFEKDLADVREMVRRGLVEPARALALFRAIERELPRYPAIDPSSFRRAVEAAFIPEGLHGEPAGPTS